MSTFNFWPYLVPRPRFRPVARTEYQCCNKYLKIFCGFRPVSRNFELPIVIWSHFCMNRTPIGPRCKIFKHGSSTQIFKGLKLAMFRLIASTYSPTVVELIVELIGELFIGESRTEIQFFGFSKGMFPLNTFRYFK